MSTIYRSEAGGRRIVQRYREQLDAWPAPAEHLRIDTREGETFALACGPPEAPPVVLLHGSGANSSTWRGDIASWSRNFRVFAVDMVGEPGLSAPSRPRLDTDAVTLWLDDVLDGLGLTHSALVGMSLGGWSALDYTLRRPDRVDRLALLCPGGIGRQTTGRVAAVAALSLFGQSGRRRSAARMTGLAPDNPLVDEIIATFGIFRPRTERLPVFDDAALAGIGVPVLAIVGDRDLMFDSADTATRLERALPTARVHVLPGVGHAILGQTETVLEFLREP
ncbi:alpha/beta fold hydrolase [Rhodococcus artemisiae]|uniref:Alpha/beta fold hydrolase n=1 Tax=Rhodococcus artemisiae TaxID=714159 RepID=A0ABU7L3S9_9NOCA|nr:alpha/beta fold hydrolase [Rhodococcus artemisiae]MEE2056205.1 alpha/beta fold hydrolase [Rhodococcus artemisiae]